MTERHYLLPCGCGKQVAVSETQAGTTVTCECGAVLSVPTLRGLRALSAVHDGGSSPAPPSAPRPRSSSNTGLPMFGCLFGLACVVFLGAAGTAGILWFFRLGIDTSVSVEQYAAEGDASIDKMPLDESLMLWNHYLHEGLLPAEAPDPLVNWARARTVNNLILVAGVIAGVALAAAIIAGTIEYRRRRRGT